MTSSDTSCSSILEEKKPDGNPVLKTMNFDLVCDKCKGSERALTCKCLWEERVRLFHQQLDEFKRRYTALDNAPACKFTGKIGGRCGK